MTELDYLQSIYELLQKLVPLAHLVSGLIQFILVVFVCVVLYKLFNLFF